MDNLQTPRFADSLVIRVVVTAGLLAFLVVQLAGAIAGLYAFFGLLGTLIILAIGGVVGLGLPIVVGNYLCAMMWWGWPLPIAAVYSLTGFVFVFPQATQGFFRRYLG